MLSNYSLCLLGSPVVFTSLFPSPRVAAAVPLSRSLLSPLVTISPSLGGSLSAPCLPYTWAQKWRRFGAVLYGGSGCALARLELQDGSEKPRRGEAARRVIRLSDCLRVAEAGGEASSPRDTSAFFLETKERLYLLAAPTAERGEWMQAICLLAFPGQRKELSGPEGRGSWPCMEENELYSSTTTVAPCKEFAVTMRPTEASERCRLRGSYTLRAGESALELWGGPEPGTQLYDWPYRFLRRFGRDKVTFSFEAGRRCISGEGNFEFETRQGNEIFLALEEAISAQKNATPPGPQTQPAAVPTVLPRPESPYSRPHDSLPPPSPTAPVPAPRPRGPEGEYAVPFDAVARNLGKSLRGILAVHPQPPVDPLYDSIEEHPPVQPDHIYDEPEGVAALSLYDSPREPRGEAWRRQATADGDPSGLQHVYSAGQDFSASGWPQGTEYDNVVLKKGPK
ncbi:PREDICTED: docking protein 2 isoform X1 [Ceratotherium simum simum]|uniref:Docking protein 2 isoform X1 n=1 Tax=Ceratotherium simum simum TaxID=73337 RepID=A0ABM1DK37_CERSS|nr:PREDICTED: docking protein 2 isoform X1 [Ceratotherium simum simum]